MSHTISLRSMEDQLVADKNIPEMAKGDMSEYSSSFTAEKADLAESETSFMVVQSSDAAGNSS